MQQPNQTNPVYPVYPVAYPYVAPYQAPEITPKKRRVTTQTGMRIALGIGALALCQIAIATNVTMAHAGGVLIVQHQAASFTTTGSVLQPELMLPSLGVSILTCWGIGCLSFIFAHAAAREAAIATQSVSLGRRAGIIAALGGAAIWIALAALIALLTGSDGAFIVVDPSSSTPLLTQHIAAGGIALIRGIILGGCGVFIALSPISVGANAARSHGAQ